MKVTTMMENYAMTGMFAFKATGVTYERRAMLMDIIQVTVWVKRAIESYLQSPGRLDTRHIMSVLLTHPFEKRISDQSIISDTGTADQAKTTPTKYPLK